MALDRRQLLAGFSALAAAGPVWASEGGLCLYARGTVSRRTRLRPASPMARGVVDEIARAIGYSGWIEVRESPSISNAGALPGGRGTPHLILYNADFMNELDAMHPAAPIAVLAHEVGHFTAPARAGRTSWDRELAADHAGGCIMARLGADRHAATVALRALRGRGSRSHPDPRLRQGAAVDGHRVCRG